MFKFLTKCHLKVSQRAENSFEMGENDDKMAIILALILEFFL